MASCVTVIHVILTWLQSSLVVVVIESQHYTRRFTTSHWFPTGNKSGDLAGQSNRLGFCDTWMARVRAQRTVVVLVQNSLWCVVSKGYRYGSLVDSRRSNWQQWPSEPTSVIFRCTWQNPTLWRFGTARLGEYCYCDATPTTNQNSDTVSKHTEPGFLRRQYLMPFLSPVMSFQHHFRLARYCILVKGRLRKGWREIYYWGPYFVKVHFCFLRHEIKLC